MKLLQATALTVLTTLVLATGLLSVGCSTPAYSGRERFEHIGYGMSYDAAQMQDDIDHVFLLRPGSRLSVWNVQTPD